MTPGGTKSEKIERQGHQKWAQGHQKWAKGHQKWAKWEPKGAKREPKGAKSEPKGAKSEPKGDQNASKNQPLEKVGFMIVNGCLRVEFLGVILGAFSIKNATEKSMRKLMPNKW